MQETPSKSDYNKTQPQSPFVPINATSNITVKEYEKSLDVLKKENFDLKLRVFHLEEKLHSSLPGTLEESLKENVELRIKYDELKEHYKGSEFQQSEIKDVSNNEEIGKLRAQISALESTLIYSREQVTQQETENESLRKHIESLELTVNFPSSPGRPSLDFLETRLLNELEQTTKHVKSLESTQGASKDEMSNLRTYCTNLQAEIQNAAKFTNNISHMIETNKKIPEEAESLETQLVFLKEGVEEQRWELQNTKAKLLQTEKSYQSYNDANSKLGNEVKQLREENTKVLGERNALFSDYEKSVNSLQSQKRVLEDARKDLDARLNQLTSETVPYLVNERDGLQEKNREILSELDMQRRRFEDAISKNTELQNKNFEYEQSAFHQQKKISQSAKEKEHVEYELRKLGGETEGMLKRISELTEETKRLSFQLNIEITSRERIKEEFDQELFEASKEVKKRGHDLERMQEAVSGLRAENEKIKTEIVTLRTNMVRVKDTASEKTERVRELETLKTKHQSEINELNEKITSLVIRNNALKDQCDGKAKHMADMNNKSSILEQKIHSIYKDYEHQKKKLKNREKIITEALKKLESLNNPIFESITDTLRKQNTLKKPENNNDMNEF